MKKISLFVLMMFLLISLPMTAFAQEEAQSATDEMTQEELYQEQLDMSGANELLGYVPRGTQKYLEQLHVDELNPENITDLSVGDFFGVMVQMVKDYFSSPVTVLVSLVGIVLLCALASALGEHFTNKPLYGVFSVIAVLTVLTVAASPILACVQRAGQMVESLSNFMLGFIPVFATVTALSGQPATGGTYHVLLFSATQIVSQVLVRIVVPFLMLYLAFSIAGSIFPQLKMDGFIASAKKIATVLMGLSLTLFVGLLTVQAFVGTSADTVTIKTTKFVVGNLVPVVGGALSDAVSSVQGCLKLLKSTVGAFGIIASLFIFIPIVLESLVWVVTLNIASAVGDLMDVKHISGMLKSASSVLSLLVTILLCFALLFVVSITILLMIGGSA